MRQTLLAVSAAVLLCCCLSPVLAQDDLPPIPMGFRGLEFGTPLAEIPHLVYVRTETAGSEMNGFWDMDLYAPDKPDLNYAGIRLDEVLFGFRNDTFNRAILLAQGRDAYNALLSAMAEAYGLRDSVTFSMEGCERCILVHKTYSYDTVEGHSWLWGIQESDGIFWAVDVEINTATGEVRARLGFLFS
ncbi:MAG: hypothetical protein D6E12_14320 [Desulfovibrio sp.]|nr:MAG: hypothetical protein D6E12_14320 [Desulfovibrio sp.]